MVLPDLKPLWLIVTISDFQSDPSKHLFRASAAGVWCAIFDGACVGLTTKHASAKWCSHRPLSFLTMTNCDEASPLPILICSSNSVLRVCVMWGWCRENWVDMRATTKATILHMLHKGHVKSITLAMQTLCMNNK